MTEPQEVIVHPLVLLNVVDHYNRVAKDTQRRVVGILLGESAKDGRVDCTNSFAVPFEEDSRDKTVWFLDHDFLEEMAHMFKVRVCFATIPATCFRLVAISVQLLKSMISTCDYDPFFKV